MNRPCRETKLEEARRLFYAYRFRAAYQLYHQAFSTMPFKVTDAQLEHVGCYARTLIELDRLEELRFYIPILESHYQKSQGAYAGFALGYVNFLIGSKPMAKKLFEFVREKSGPDVDLRIKAVMMLARLTESNLDSIPIIHSIAEIPRDPQLAKLLEVWRCCVLRYEGNSRQSIERLGKLIDSTAVNGEEWYCLLTAKDALVRAHLDLKNFNEARREIAIFQSLASAHRSRTVEMHIRELNESYRGKLGMQHILRSETRSMTQLSYGGFSIRLQHDGLRGLVHLFHQTPAMTFKRVRNALSIGEREIIDLVDRLSEKLQMLALPFDCLDRQGSRLELIPILKSPTKET